MELMYFVSVQDSVNYSKVTLGVQLLSTKSLYIFSPFSSNTPLALFYSTIIFLTKQLVLNSTPFFYAISASILDIEPIPPSTKAHSPLELGNISPITWCSRM